MRSRAFLAIFLSLAVWGVAIVLAMVARNASLPKRQAAVIATRFVAEPVPARPARPLTPHERLAQTIAETPVEARTFSFVVTRSYRAARLNRPARQARTAHRYAMPTSWVVDATFLTKPELTEPIEIGVTPAMKAASGRINAALDSIVDIDFENAPLEKVVAEIEDKFKINARLDRPGLKEAGVEPVVISTLKVTGISLRSALQLLLDELQLKCVIRDETLLITSPTKAESDEYVATIVYPVNDLLAFRNEKGRVKVEIDPLQDLIFESASHTWGDSAGPSPIGVLLTRSGYCFAISQSQEVHRKIAGLLAALRHAGEPIAKLSQKASTPVAATKLSIHGKPDPQPKPNRQFDDDPFGQ